MKSDPNLVHHICKAFSSGRSMGLDGAHPEVPPVIDLHVDDNYRLAYRLGVQEAQSHLASGTVPPAEQEAVKQHHAAGWKDGAQLALTQVNRFLPREEAQLVGEINAALRMVHEGTAFADGYDAVMEAAENLARPFKDAQPQIREIFRLTAEAHAYLDMAGVPACEPVPERETRSFFALVRRLETLEYRNCAPIPA